MGDLGAISATPSLQDLMILGLVILMHPVCCI